jgi:hypothetical protein
MVGGGLHRTAVASDALLGTDRHHCSMAIASKASPRMALTVSVIANVAVDKRSNDSAVGSSLPSHCRTVGFSVLTIAVSG